MLTIDTIDPAAGVVGHYPFKPGEMRSWHALPGASAIRIVLRVDGIAVFQSEFEIKGDSVVSFEIRETPVGWEGSTEGGRPLVPLPSSRITAPSTLRVLQPARAVDVFFLIDGTTLHPNDKREFEPFLRTPGWKETRQKFMKFWEALPAEFPGGVRVGVGAFGDQSMTPGRSDNYVLQPKQWRMTLPAQTERDWAELRATDGGDFIDALADGLHRCAALPWRVDARKLVVVFGDSPGYSVLHAGHGPVALADGQLREYDVYQEAGALHDQNVEIATIFHSPSAEGLRDRTDFAAELVDYARDQYLRLASQPAWSLTSPDWDPVRFAEAWKSWTGMIARGASPPIQPTE